MKTPKMKTPKMAFDNLLEMKQYLKIWQHILGLDFWYIDCRLVEELVSDGEECWGLNTHNHVDRSALITIRQYKEDRDGNSIKKYCAEQILVHELLHCVYNWLQKDDKDYAVAYYDVMEHQQLDLMAEALILARYNLKRDFFSNIKD